MEYYFDVKKQPATAWIATFNSWKKKKLPPALQEELEWSGLLESLELMGKQKITKGQIQDMIDVGGVHVETKTLGEDTDEWKTLIKKDEALRGKLKALDHIKKPERYAKLDEELYEVGLKLDRIRDKNRTEYEGQVLPGGKPGSYKEMLLVLPDQPGKYIVYDYAAADAVDGEYRDYIVAKYDTKDEAIEKVNGNNDYAFATENQLSSDFMSHHFPEAPNLLVHIRVDERIDAEGDKTLFINEIQSDHSNEMRKQLENIEKDITNNFKTIVGNMEKQGVLKEIC